MKVVIACLLLFTVFSCGKNNSAVSVQQLNGEVIAALDECSSSTGSPYIIKYTDLNNNVDSFMTVSLPEDLKVPGTKISFKVKEAVGDYIYCTMDIIPPPQLPIYDVKKQ